MKSPVGMEEINPGASSESDSDFVSDKEARISVFGYIFYFC